MDKLVTASNKKNQSSEHSVSCRPIENGYIVKKSCWDGDEYHSTECFTPEKPDLSSADYAEPSRAVARAANSGSSLRGAVDHLKR